MTPMTPMRERLARALHDVVGPLQGHVHDAQCDPELGVDMDLALDLMKALGPDVFLVDVETVARRLYESEHSDGCRCDTRYPEVWQGYMDEARRLLGGGE